MTARAPFQFRMEPWRWAAPTRRTFPEVPGVEAAGHRCRLANARMKRSLGPRRRMLVGQHLEQVGGAANAVRQSLPRRKQLAQLHLYKRR